MVANLQQNAKARPIVSPFLPTLLRSGVMYLLLNSAVRWDKEERWLFGKDCCLCFGVTAIASGLPPCLLQETMHAMGHCVYPDHCGNQPFPIHDIRDFSEANLKQLSGNDSWSQHRRRLADGAVLFLGAISECQAMHCGVVGSLWSVILVRCRRKTLV